MPEEPEAETEKQHEAIREELENSRAIWIGSLLAGVAGLIFFVLPMVT